MDMWRYGDMEIWRYEDMEIWRFGDKGYEIGDMV